jgi:general secretion pathway protein F/type IV pilus assembly protein PilC
MPDFSYVARNADGQKVTGTIDAASRSEVLAQLAARTLFPIEIGVGTGVRAGGRVGRVPAQTMAVTYSQLADLLKSGVPLLRALDVIRRQTSHRVLDEVLGQVYRQVEQGSTLAHAMLQFPTVFGEMATSMIRAGGEGGFLEEALMRVADFTETQEDLRKRVIGALAYPAVLATFGTLVVTGLMVFLVPKFEGLFDNLRQRGELPVLTEWLLFVSDQMWPWGLLVLMGMVAAAALLWMWSKTDRGQWWKDYVKLRLPLVGKVFLSLSVARFCRVLGTMLRQGVPILPSLDVSSDSTGNRILAEAIARATENISSGEALAEPLAASGSFPVTVTEMISVAEESNTLDTVLVDIADSLEKRTWRQLDLAVRLLEPLMLIILAGVVLVLVIALLMPVLKMSTTI